MSHVVTAWGDSPISADGRNGAPSGLDSSAPGSAAGSVGLSRTLRHRHGDAVSFTTRTDSNSGSAMCQFRSSIVLAPSADGNLALRWANETGGGASGPTLKKGSWLRVRAWGEPRHRLCYAVCRSLLRGSRRQAVAATCEGMDREH